MKLLYVIAVDPGQNTGVAVYSVPKDKILNCYTKDFFTVQEFLSNSFGDCMDQCVVYVETPQKMLYDRHESQMRKEELTIMYKAGENRREAELLARAIKHIGFSKVKAINPIRKEKWKQSDFELATGLKQRTNEHERDATRIALYFGRDERLNAKIRKEL